MQTRWFSMASIVAISCASITFGAVAGSAPMMAAPSAPASVATATLLVSALAGGSGSTIGPGDALFVTESVAGRVTRVDPQTGERTTFAEGLPPMLPAVGLGGAMDVAFIGTKAYVLVTLVGSDVGGTDVVGIYRVDGPQSVTPIADIGEFSMNHPPNTDFVVPTGVQYALETYRGGFLVTDGHHNRLLRVTLEHQGGIERGEVSELMAFDNIVPTGLAISGWTIYMAEAGPSPHLPEDGRIVAFGPEFPTVEQVASGAKLLVDVECGRGRTLFGLAQGDFPEGAVPGSPALPGTGALLQANSDGTFTEIIGSLDRPTSLELLGNTAYVVTLTGEIWRITGIDDPPYGASR